MKKLIFLGLAVALVFGAARAEPGTINYGDVTPSGGFQSGHFDDVWDLTADDVTISFTYDANGLVDDFGGAAHAWAELGVRTAQPPYPDFNPNWSGDICSEQTFDLFAGQNMDVGEVIVQRVGNVLYVKYVITEDGWFLTKTHLAVGESPGDIPQKNGNPIPGKFPYKEIHDPPVTEYPYPPIDVSGLGMPLYIAAHAAVIKLIGEGCESPQWATNVVEYLQGNQQNGNPVTNPDRKDPEEALGAPDGPGTGSFYSLGFVSNGDGYIVLGFDYPVYNGPGNDIVSVEITWRKDNVPPYVESADIYVIVDGDEYYAGAVNNYDPLNQSTYNYVSIPDGLEYVEAIKLVDTTDRSVFSPFPTGDGYDVDAVGACYLLEQKETAWGDGSEFSGKNWATYIVYDPVCTPVEGSGVWLATDYDWAANTFDPDPPSSPILDLDDKLILQRRGGYGEGDYDLSSPPPNPWANHAVWFDRDGVDQWQAQMWGAIDGVTYNTGGTYEVVITLHATSATTGEAYMTVNGEPQGFYVPGWHSGPLEYPQDIYPAGMTFAGDMKHLQVFYGLYGYGATHTVTFEGITVSQ